MSFECHRFDQKTNEIVLRISVLASKKRSNQKGAKLFLEFDTFFFEIQFKNTSNLIFQGFKVPSERFLFKNFKTGLTFWHM